MSGIRFLGPAGRRWLARWESSPDDSPTTTALLVFQADDGEERILPADQRLKAGAQIAARYLELLDQARVVRSSVGRRLAMWLSEHLSNGADCELVVDDGTWFVVYAGGVRRTLHVSAASWAEAGTLDLLQAFLLREDILGTLTASEGASVRVEVHGRAGGLRWERAE